MLRTHVKNALASGLHWSACDVGIGAVSGARRAPLILAYHRVADDTRAEFLPGMTISRAMLERHLDWVGRRFRFASLDEIGARLEAGESFERPVAAVTFDDGYCDVYENAFPLLARKGIPAAVFVVTELVGTDRPQLHDYLYVLLVRTFATAERSRLVEILKQLTLPLSPEEAEPAFRGGAFPTLRILVERLCQSDLWSLAEALESEIGWDPDDTAELRSMSWEALARMREAGFTIGSHGSTHAPLSRESPERRREETAGSRAKLERGLGTAVRHFAYPDGDFAADAVSAVAAAGYRYAYTICPHRMPKHPLLTIQRRMLWEGSCLDGSGRFSEPVLSCHVNGVFDLVTRCTRDHARGADLATLAGTSRG
jgi:peptidoglycan/xylan/chitin deacetylase (PgdA/CDA1 family)